MTKAILISVWVWFIATMLSAFMSGAFIGDTQTATLDKLSLFTYWNIGNFTVPIINLAFFDGIRTLMEPGNFSFLQGSPILIILYMLNIAIVVSFFVIFSQMVQSFVRR